MSSLESAATFVWYFSVEELSLKKQRVRQNDGKIQRSFSFILVAWRERNTIKACFANNATALHSIILLFKDLPVFLPCYWRWSDNCFLAHRCIGELRKHGDTFILKPFYSYEYFWALLNRERKLKETAGMVWHARHCETPKLDTWMPRELKRPFGWSSKRFGNFMKQSCSKMWASGANGRNEWSCFVGTRRLATL